MFYSIGIIFSILQLISSGQNDFYTSLSDLTMLLDTQDAFVKDIEKYVEGEERKLNILKSYLRHIEKSSGLKAEMYQNYRVMSFILINRLTSDLDLFKNLTSMNVELKHSSGPIYPTEIDLAGAAEAIDRIQKTYALNVTLLAEGTLKRNVRYETQEFKHTPLSANDCYIIGRTMYDGKLYKGAVEWLTEALRKYEAEDKDILMFNETDLALYFSKAYKAIDDVPNTTKWLNRLIELRADPPHSKAAILAMSYEVRLRTGNFDWDKELGYTVPTDSKNERIQKVYHALCRGEMNMNLYITKKLRCWYTRSTDPILILAPLKTEQLYMRPDIYLFHDIITDNEAEDMIDFAAPNLQRAKIQGGLSSRIRICKHTDVHDDELEAKFSRRTYRLTGLSMDSAEALQILNYGIGGYYYPHYDFFHKNHSTPVKLDNRIATVIYYLTDVVDGGSTVFLDAGLEVKPKKGSALFWMNMYPSGKEDHSTGHAACPVLFGSKWVAVKWINYLGQMFHRPCKDGEDKYFASQTATRTQKDNPI